MSSDPGHTSPLDPRTAGWLLMPRGWWSSEVYRALRTSEAQRVAELVLFRRPRFRDETHYFGGKAFVVRRGQLFDSEETLALLAGTSRKVVRVALRTLFTAGLITREKVHPSGQCPHVITVRDYELSQTIPGNGAHGRAEGGPETGLRRAGGRAPSKPQEPQEPQERSFSGASAPAPEPEAAGDGEPQNIAPASPQGLAVKLDPQPLAPVRTLPLRKARAQRPAGITDPRHAEAVKLAFDAYAQLRGEGFDFDGRDGKALRDFLTRHPQVTPLEIAERWRRSLTAPRGTAKFATFISQWNDYAGAGRPGVKRVIAAAGNWSAPDAGDFT